MLRPTVAIIMIFLMPIRLLKILPEKKETAIIATEIMVEFIENA